MISEFGKVIYNFHLSVFRSAKGEPYKPRKDFSDFDENKVPILERLESFFTSYPNVNVKDYFWAPYKVFPNENESYPLDYYTTPKSLKVYTTYMKTIEMENPDSIETLERFRDTLKFIFLFCSEKGLTLEGYKAYSEQSIPCWLAHLKDHKITFYTVHGLGISKPKVDSRILEFMFTDFYGTFQKTKNNFYLSKKLKGFSQIAINKIEEKINEPGRH